MSDIVLNLYLERNGSDQFRARLTDASGKEIAQHGFSLHVEELQTDVLRRIEENITARAASKLEVAGAQLGVKLHEAILTGPVGDAIRQAQAELEQTRQPLRLRLRIQLPELLNLPWELLYDGKQFLLPSGLLLSRSPAELTDLASQPTPLPIKILVIIANPLDLPEHQQLDTDLEEEIIVEALDVLTRSGQVKVDLVEEATIDEMQRALLADEYHIIHFVGHGSFDEETDQGILIIENEQGNQREIDSEQVANLWGAARSLRLVLMSSCLTARTGAFNAYGGTAQALLRRGVPAVVAMQHPIFEQSAMTLCKLFYTALVSGKSVDEALAEGRRALSLTGQENIEWATPTLYLRGEVGWSLQIKGKSRRPAKKEPLSSKRRVAKESFGGLLRIRRGFVGRRKEIRQIRRGFLHGASRVAIIHGLGGVGKTVLATKVAEKLLESGTFDDVLGIDARSSPEAELVLREFNAYFKRNGVDDFDSVMQSNDDLTHKALELGNLLCQRRLVVIFDNTEAWLATPDSTPQASTNPDFNPESRPLKNDIAELLFQLINTVTEGSKFLITGRYEFDIFPRGRDGGLVTRVPLYELSHIEALRLMGRLPSFSECDWNKREEIYNNVGGHPFTFNLFAERAARVGVDYVLADIRNVRKEAIGTFFLEQIYSDLRPQAKTLLCRISILRSSVPKECLDALMGTHRIETALNQLLRWGLIVRVKVKDRMSPEEEDRYVMHALVREFGLEKLGDARNEALLTAAKFYEERMKNTPFLDINLSNQSEARYYYQEAGEDLVMEHQREPGNRVWFSVRNGELEQVEEPGRIDIDLVDYYERWGNIRYSPDEERKSLETEEGKRLAESTYNLANSEYERGNFDGPFGAVKLYEDCLRFFEILPNKSRLAIALLNLGRIHQERGNLTEALQHYQRSLNTQEQLDDKSELEASGYDLGVARALGRLGDAHFNSGDHTKATELYEQSLKLMEELSDHVGMAPVLQNLATIQWTKGNSAEALRLGKQSLEVWEKLGDKRGAVQTMTNLAAFHNELGEYSEATPLLERSLAISKELDDKNGIAMSLAQIGWLRYKQGRLGAAVRYYDTARKLFEELRSPHENTVIAWANKIREQVDEIQFRTFIIVSSICDEVIATLQKGSDAQRQKLTKDLDELTRVPDEESVLALMAALHGLMTGADTKSLRAGLTEDYQEIFDGVVAAVK